jgi:succinate-semialdehyde dehydrogenase/glutarate-semialdehyde dehydrogenase
MSVENRDPWTGEVRRHVNLDEAGIESRLAAAEAAFPAWSALPLSERGQYLVKIASGLRARREAIARVMTAEMGKLRREALTEIDKSAAACEYYAEHAARYLEDQVVVTDASHSYVTFEPIGCVLAIMPWNFPIWQVFRFLAPGLMAGNVAVLKHATNVPGCADAIADVLADAGVPSGVFSVLHIDSDQAAEVIADPRVKAVTLTGSERAGRSVAATAGKHLKKCVLELGGSDPFVVLEDADLDRTVKMAVLSRFGNAGQTCIAAKRFIVVDGIADEFVRRFVEASARLQPGDPNLESTGLAPMARADLRDELHKQVQASIAKGARPILGCEPGAGDTAYPASILDHVVPGMPAYDEELFGPVASVVWVKNKARGEAVARAINAGACFVNAIVRSDVRLPFGGTKSSGFGRELAEHGIHEFMNIKTVYID